MRTPANGHNDYLAQIDASIIIDVSTTLITTFLNSEETPGSRSPHAMRRLWKKAPEAEHCVWTPQHGLVDKRHGVTLVDKNVTQFQFDLAKAQAETRYAL